MAEKKSLFANGGNGGQIVTTGNPITDLERAQDELTGELERIAPVKQAAA